VMLYQLLSIYNVKCEVDYKLRISKKVSASLEHDGYLQNVCDAVHTV
jgi:hypothetical protein